MHVAEVQLGHRPSVQQPGDIGCHLSIAKQALQDNVTTLTCLTGGGVTDSDLTALGGEGRGEGEGEGRTGSSAVREVRI